MDSIDCRPNQRLGGRGHESSIAYYAPSNRLLMLDSGLERNVFQLLASDIDVVDIRAQQPVRFFHGGKWRTHWFDFVVTYANGFRQAFMVKPYRRVAAVTLVRGAILGYCPDLHRVADDITIFTDRDFCDGDVFNAQEILDAREMSDEESFRVISEEVMKLQGAVLFHHLLLGTQSEAERRIAIWNMIERDMLVPLHHGGRITDTTLMVVVRNEEAGK